jgi:hypothetical protein
MKRLFIVLLVFAVVAHAGSVWAEDDEALKTGIDAYLYAYPLVVMDVTRLYVEKTTGARDNMFLQGCAFAHAGPTPDAGVFASTAWLDLSQEPVVLHMPAGLSVQLMDAWANVFSAPSGREARDFVIVGPSWYGDLPSAMTVIASPTDMALIIVPSRDAVENSALSQNRITLTPLSSYGKPDGAAVVQGPPVLMPMKPPSEQMADMDAKTFFTYFVRLLASNPPATTDADIITDIASLGIVPGPDFDFDALDPAVKDLLSRSVGPARAGIQSSVPQVTDEDFTTYLTRARRALTILAATMPADRLCRSPEAPSQSAEAPDEPEDTISLENGILFTTEGRKGSEPGFDIREDIARGQEFLKDKIAGCSQER